MCRYYNAETVDESWGYTRTEEALEWDFLAYSESMSST
jgi:hypothetical protein